MGRRGGGGEERGVTRSQLDKLPICLAHALQVSGVDAPKVVQRIPLLRLWDPPVCSLSNWLLPLEYDSGGSVWQLGVQDGGAFPFTVGGQGQHFEALLGYLCKHTASDTVFQSKSRAILANKYIISILFDLSERLKRNG